MLQPNLRKVEPADSYCIRLYYVTGEVKLFDVSPYITGSWYEELKDADYFKTVRLLPGGIGIEWPHGQDIAPHELYDSSIVENVLHSAVE